MIQALIYPSPLDAFFGLPNNILLFLMSFILVVLSLHHTDDANKKVTRMQADAQRDGRPAEYRWRPLFNVATFG